VSSHDASLMRKAKRRFYAFRIKAYERAVAMTSNRREALLLKKRLRQQQ
jgi:predicted RNA polymerase sigma factor